MSDKPTRFVGIDGCRAGWFVVSVSGKHLHHQLLQTQDFAYFFNANDVILVDMPIGLSDTQNTRTCDALVRQKLGRMYASSVFSPPVRAALYADTYREACRINQEKTGKKFSIQSWNICPKIRELDSWLDVHPEYKGQIMESHPELLFMQLNGNNTLLHKKKTGDGFQKRLELLSELCDGFEDYFSQIRTSYLKKEVQDDDILDAAVLALYASSIGITNCLPEIPEIDAHGIPMAIYY